MNGGPIEPAGPAGLAGLAGPAQAPVRRGSTVAWWRLPLLAFGFVALVAGTGAGLARLAWPMPEAAAAVAALHGPLMICGFFGVVISLERAVAIGRPWAYAAPVAAALGTAAVLHGAPGIAPWLYLAAGAALLAASLQVLARQRTGFNAVIALAAACWGIGTAVWATGAPVHDVIGWWLAFLILTIAGERLELSRFMPPQPSARRFFAAIVLGIVVALPAWTFAAAARPLFGIGLVLLALWLVRNDIARRTVRQTGLTRYIAVCLLSGYFWLALGGATIIAFGLEPGSAAYDAALHSLLLGFVFAMVFGHAPIVFPAVLRVKLPYHPIFFAPLVLLHLSLALRIAGDAMGWADAGAASAFTLVRMGALLSALALLSFVLTMACTAWRARSS